MTNSKIIISGSALVLAIAGAFTTKGSNTLNVNGKARINGAGACVAFVTPCTSATGTFTNFTTTGSPSVCTQGSTVFTANSNCADHHVLRVNPNQKTI